MPHVFNGFVKIFAEPVRHLHRRATENRIVTQLKPVLLYSSNLNY